MEIEAPLAVEVAYAAIAGLALTLTQPREERRRLWRRPLALAVAIVLGVLAALGLMVPVIILVRIGVPVIPAAAIPLVAWVLGCRAVGRARDKPGDDVARASNG